MIKIPASVREAVLKFWCIDLRIGALVQRRRYYRGLNCAGQTDRKGIWLPNKSEKVFGSFSHIRGPSIAWPLNYFKRAKTYNHCQLLFLAYMTGYRNLEQLSEDAHAEFSRVLSVGTRHELWELILFDMHIKDSDVEKLKAEGNYKFLLSTAVKAKDDMLPWLILADLLDELGISYKSRIIRDLFNTDNFPRKD